MENIMQLKNIYLKKVIAKVTTFAFQKEKNLNSFKSIQSRTVKLNLVIDNKSGQINRVKIWILREMQMLLLTDKIFNNLTNKKNKG